MSQYSRHPASPVTSRDFYNAAVPQPHWMDRLTLRGTIALILAGSIAGFIGLVAIVTFGNMLSAAWH